MAAAAAAATGTAAAAAAAGAAAAEKYEVDFNLRTQTVDPCRPATAVFVCRHPPVGRSVVEEEEKAAEQEIYAGRL